MVKVFTVVFISVCVFFFCISEGIRPEDLFSSRPNEQQSSSEPEKQPFPELNANVSYFEIAQKHGGYTYVKSLNGIVRFKEDVKQQETVYTTEHWVEGFMFFNDVTLFVRESVQGKEARYYWYNIETKEKVPMFKYEEYEPLKTGYLALAQEEEEKGYYFPFGQADGELFFYMSYFDDKDEFVKSDLYKDGGNGPVKLAENVSRTELLSDGVYYKQSDSYKIMRCDFHGIIHEEVYESYGLKDFRANENYILRQLSTNVELTSRRKGYETMILSRTDDIKKVFLDKENAYVLRGDYEDNYNKIYKEVPEVYPDKEFIINDEEIWGLALLDDWIYISCLDIEKEVDEICPDSRIFRIKKDGTGLEPVVL